MDQPPSEEWFAITEDEARPYMMRHVCSRDGCWNELHRPRLELLKKCFGGLETRIKPQDIDGSVEHLGFFLFLEFKSSRGAFGERDGKTAADRYHKSITSQRRIVLRDPLVLSAPTTTSVYVVGDSQTMAVDEVRVIHDGEMQEWESLDLYGLQVMCWEWFEWTKKLDSEDRKRRRDAVSNRKLENPWLDISGRVRASKEPDLTTSTT